MKKNNSILQSQFIRSSVRQFAVFLLFMAQFGTKKTQAQCSSCLTNYLELGTGYNHEAGMFYSVGDNDEYWQVTSAPGNVTLPMCAIAYGTSGHMVWDANGNSLSHSTGIGITANGIGDGDLPCAQTCGTPNAPVYRYKRNICVNTTARISNSNLTGSTWSDIALLYCGDLSVRRITLYDPSNTVIDDHIICNRQSNCPFSYYWSGYLATGVYSLFFEVTNDWDCHWPLPPTPTGIEVGGYIGSQFDIFTDNEHFGKSPICSPQYPPGPEFQVIGNHCVGAPVIPSPTSTFTITPFNNGAGQNTYTISGTSSVSIIQTGPGSGTFDAGVGSYTITSTDSKNCSYTQVLNVYFNPLLSVSPMQSCVATGANSSISVAPSPGVFSDFDWQVNGGPKYTLINPTIPLSQGVFTITATDIHSCTATATTTIGNAFSLWSTATPPCLSTGGTSILNSGPIPNFSGTKFYSYNGGPFLLPPTFSVNTAGVYTVVASDAFGCTASTTVSVFQSPSPTISLTASTGCINQGGSSIITANATPGATYLFQIRPPGGNWSASQVSNIFTCTSIGKYAVRVVDGNGCPSTPEFITIGDCGHCYSENPPPNAKWFIDPIASVDFPSGSVSSSNPIVIDGTLTIDQDLNIWNNPNVYFTYLAKAKMTNTTSPSICYINNSTLKPCYYWWTGILATNSNQTIKIDQGSVIKYMFLDQSMPNSAFLDNGGINSLNGATIDATNSSFENNFNSIVITRSGASYAGVIERNTFVLNDPIYSVIGGAFRGVVIHDAIDVQVGGPLNDVNRGNLFSNLANGISVKVGSNAMGSPLISNIRIHNNRFESIKDFWALSGNYRKSKILNNTFFPTGGVPWAGSAVAINSSAGYIGNSYFYPELTVAVQDLTTNYDDNFTFFPGIYDCDLGVVSDNSNLIADQLYIDNTTFAIMCNSTRKKNYQITGNFMYSVHYGIQLINAINKELINGNHITTLNEGFNYLPYSGAPFSMVNSPVAIKTEFGLQNIGTGLYNEISENFLTIPFKTGISILSLNGDAHHAINDNEIAFSTNAIDQVAGYAIKSLYGISLNNAKASELRNNTIIGLSNYAVWDARNSMGIYMNNSPKSILDCNKVKWTRYGFYAWGNNITSPANVVHNKFSGNKYPWYFLDAGATLPASFGTQGGGGTDNGNNFLGTVNRLNSNGFKVFRNSNISMPDVINTSTAVLNLNESGSTTSGSEYNVGNPLGLINTDPCVDPLFIFGGEGAGDEDIENVVEDSVTYIDHEEVGEWMDEYRVYSALDADSTLRYSTLDMQTFYDTRRSMLIGKIYDANKAIDLLTDSSTNANNYVVRYNNAVQANESIVGGEDWEMNEHDLNVIHLKLISKSDVDTVGTDTFFVDSLAQFIVPKIQFISNGEKEFVSNMAHACPFVEGAAVYRARALWAYFEPGAIYDDRVLCIAGSNKSTNSTDFDIDSLYEKQIERSVFTRPVINTHHNNVDEVLVYPNPTNSVIIVEYTCTSPGKFMLINSMGQIMINTQLGEEKRKVQMQVNNLSRGIYYYKCCFEGCEDVCGKLTIE